jgi:hypothetical protein
VKLNLKKQIWRDLVNFANATSESIDEAWYELTQHLKQDLAHICVAQDDDPPEDDDQAKLRKMLAILCVKNPTPAQVTVLLSIVRQHLKNIDRVVAYTADDPDPITFTLVSDEPIPEREPTYHPDPYKEIPCAFKLLHLTHSCWTFFDLVCQFLVNEHLSLHDKYLRGGRAKSLNWPIRMCDGPQCVNFALPWRKDRYAFCSRNCCAKKHQRETPPEQRSDYQFLYRLSEIKDRGLLKARLNNKQVRDRLSAIRKRLPKYEEKIGELQKRARG